MCCIGTRSVMNVCLFLLVVIAFAFDSEATDLIQRSNSSDRLPHFEKKYFTTAALNSADGVYLLVNDGPIVLRDCRRYGFMNLRIKLYESVYHSVQPSRSFYSGNEEDRPGADCWLHKIRLKNFFFPGEAFPAEIRLEAIVGEDEDEIEVVASTILNVSREFDEGLDNPIFMADGVEYVVLNYRLYKAFLCLVLVTGVLIVLLEIRDILVRYRRVHSAGAYDVIYYI